MYFFTADEHYGHTNIIKHCNRPFKSVGEMDLELIKRFNKKVGTNDITIHAGDFCWCKSYKEAVEKYISKLNGNHIFVKGSHDRWLPKSAKYMWRKLIGNQFIVVCHYTLRTWERSHYGSWNLYGHSHGRLIPMENQYDVGVDCNNFYPISLIEIKQILDDK